jgi:hypothetical protein
MLPESYIALALIIALVAYLLFEILGLLSHCRSVWISDAQEREEERTYLRDNIHQLVYEIINNNWYGPRTDQMLHEALLATIQQHRELSR